MSNHLQISVHFYNDHILLLNVKDYKKGELKKFISDLIIHDLDHELIGGIFVNMNQVNFIKECGFSGKGDGTR